MKSRLLPWVHPILKALARTFGAVWRRITADRQRLWAWGGFVLIATLSSLFVAGTHRRLSQTADEPNHLATGLEWWQHRTYRLHPENPPLARIAIAASPHRKGWKLPRGGNAWQKGTHLLYGGRGPQAYRNRLHRMRMGVLPFHLLTLLVVWLWGLRLAGHPGGLAATVLLATASPYAAHAGLATTDAPAVATLLLALYCFWRWLESPGWIRGALLGLGTGLALATKLSTVLFLPAGALVAAACWAVSRWRKQRRPNRPADPPETESRGLLGRPWLLRIATSGLALILAFFVIWATYRFTWGRPAELPGVKTKLAQCVSGKASARRLPRALGLKGRLLTSLARSRVPAPGFVQSAIWVCAHNAVGHRAYLQGRTSQRGFGRFFGVAVGVKTPLPLLVLGVLGLGWALGLFIRRGLWPPVAVGLTAVAVIGLASRGNIHIGLRHVLVVYPLLALVAGWTVATLWRQAAAGDLCWLRRLGLVTLIAWQGLGYVRIHPDHLGYFNAFGGPEPGRILVDSDLDWGQDLLALEDIFHHTPVERLHIAYFGTANVCRHGLPRLVWLVPHRKVTGWIAISEMYFRGLRTRMFRNPCDPRTAYAVRQRGREGYAWLDRYRPVLSAGRSIRIYYIPPNPSPP